MDPRLESLAIRTYVALSYCVMLVVMTFNVGIIMSVLLGYCVGHFLFSKGFSERPSQAEDTKLIASVNDENSLTRVCH